MDYNEEEFEIWLEPNCPECNRIYNHWQCEGRHWDNKRGMDCKDCGRPWVKFELSLDQPEED